jgi:hypothetical protein
LLYGIESSLDHEQYTCLCSLCIRTWIHGRVKIWTLEPWGAAGCICTLKNPQSMTLQWPLVPSWPWAGVQHQTCLKCTQKAHFPIVDVCSQAFYICSRYFASSQALWSAQFKGQVGILPVSLLRTAWWEARLWISTCLCLLITKTAQFRIHSWRYILHSKDASTHCLQALICLVSAHTRHRHPRREGAFHSMQSIIPAYGCHTYNHTQGIFIAHKCLQAPHPSIHMSCIQLCIHRRHMVFAAYWCLQAPYPCTHM